MKQDLNYDLMAGSQDFYFDLMAESLVDDIKTASSISEGEKILSDQLHYIYTQGLEQGVLNCIAKLEHERLVGICK